MKVEPDELIAQNRRQPRYQIKEDTSHISLGYQESVSFVPHQRKPSLIDLRLAGSLLAAER